MHASHTSSSAKGPPLLVIFGCGYVGSAVADEALARGWRVVALTRNQERTAALRTRGAQVVCAALESDAWHAKMPCDPDFILNAVSSGGGGIEGYWRSYVEGTRSILRWAAGCSGRRPCLPSEGLAAGASATSPTESGCHAPASAAIPEQPPAIPATFIYTSSTSVYAQDGGEVVTEDAPVGGGSEASKPLIETENMVRSAREFRRTFVLRLAGIYGPGRHHLLDQLRTGAAVFPGTGAHRLNLIHRDDIVRAILACFDAAPEIAGSVFNVADDSPSTKETAGTWLAAQLGVPAPQFARDMPALPAGVVLPRGRSGPVPDRVIANSRLKTTLGWRPQFPDFRAGYGAIFAREKTGAV